MTTKNTKRRAGRRDSGKSRHRLARSGSASLRQAAGTESKKLPTAKFGYLFLTERTAPFSPPIIALLLCLLVVLSYLPVFQAGLVWDDVILSKAEPLHSLFGIWQIWFEPLSLKKIEGHYWPVLYSTLWLEYQLWGLAPLGYHIVNLLLHLTATLLLWRLLLRLGVPGAWMVAMVFAVHPLHVESVAWIIGRKDVLAALFAMASALAYLHFIASGHLRHYGLSLLLLMLGMLSKTTIAAFPMTLLIWHWWQQGRLSHGDIMKVLPFLLMTVCISVADWSYYKGLEHISFDYSSIERVLIAARAIWFYVGKLFWPVELAVIYPFWEVDVVDPFGWGCLLAVVLVTVLLWYFRYRIGRGPLAGALFFMVTLSPVLGFIDYGYMQFSLVADRYQYLAGIGIIATIVGGTAHWLGKPSYSLNDLSGNNPPTNNPSNPQRKFAILMVIPLIILAMLTYQQARIYRHSGTFFKHIIALNPQARRAHHNLGNYLKSAGRLDEALTAFQTSLEKDPEHAGIYNNIGVVWQNKNQLEQAKKYYRLALEKDSHHFYAMKNLAQLLTSQHHYKEAYKLLQAVIKINPKYASAHALLGVVFANRKQLKKALDSLNRALSLDPSLQEARDNREKVLTRIRNKSK